MNEFIRVSALSKSFFCAGKQIRVLKEVELIISKGEKISIVGPSGIGKSTLLHLLGALDRPDEGQIIFDGTDIFKLNNSQLAEFRRTKVGNIFQFYHLLAEFTALENVMIPALMYRDKKRTTHQIREGAKHLLERVGLADRLDHRPSQLSGGEIQRVACARSLMNNPELILADEPTGNLDTKTALEVYNILDTLVKEEKKTLILATHNESLASKSNRIFRFKDDCITN